MDKIIGAIFGIILVSLTVIIPMALVAMGTACILEKSFAWGIPMLILGIVLFWAIKPFSIISGKDFKIF